MESPVPVRVRANAVQYALVVWSSGLSPHSVVGLKEVMLSFINQADQKVFCFSLFVIICYPSLPSCRDIHQDSSQEEYTWLLEPITRLL